MTGMWIWLENTDLAMWVGLSLWAYPSLLALHIVGLAVVVGIFSMRDLRLLGLTRGLLPIDFILPVRFALAGFVLNAISGFLLFTSQASVFVNSTSFLVKISCITLGMLLAWRIQVRLSARMDQDRVTHTTRLLAFVSLLCWASAIVAGRLIAYLG